MSDVDNISFVGDIEFTATRAGKVKRDYKSSVYKVNNPDTEEVGLRPRVLLLGGGGLLELMF